MAQTLGTAIEPVALGATPAPLAASFPSQGAADSTAQQSRKAAVAALARASAAATQAAAPSEPPPTPAAAQAVIDSINAEWLTAGKSLELSIDFESNRSVVIVRDTVTGDVIGQFPTEQLLRMQQLLGAQPNLLIDTTA